MSNCINCGGIVEGHKCGYCGTPYRSEEPLPDPAIEPQQNRTVAVKEAQYFSMDIGMAIWGYMIYSDLSSEVSLSDPSELNIVKGSCYALAAALISGVFPSTNKSKDNP